MSRLRKELSSRGLPISGGADVLKKRLAKGKA